jgi:hypothetical protein
MWPVALQLAVSFTKINSESQLLICILEDFPDDVLAWFDRAGDNIEVRRIPLTPMPPTVKPMRPNWAVAWNKLHLVSLEDEFDRIVFIDADSMFLKNSDELLRMEGWASAPGQCSHCEFSYGFNGGLFAFRPNKAQYNELLALANTTREDNWWFSEQGLLSEYVQSAERVKNFVWLAPLYNLMAWGCDCVPKDVAYATIKIVHWYCTPDDIRPWVKFVLTCVKVCSFCVDKRVFFFPAVTM